MTDGVKMKCMFNPEIECTVYDVAKELETVLKPTYILEKACLLYAQNGLCLNVLSDLKDRMQAQLCE